VPDEELSASRLKTQAKRAFLAYDINVDDARPARLVAWTA